MYTCPGSIEIASLGTVTWEREPLEDRSRLRYGAIAEDIDFELPSGRLAAFIRAQVDGFVVRIPRKASIGFAEVLFLPSDTPLSDVIEATLNLLRIGYQPED